MTAPRLATARFTLRPPDATDAGWIARHIARPEVQQMLTSPPHPYERRHAEAWIGAQWGAPAAYVIEPSQGGEGDPLGVVTLAAHAEGNELGYWLRPEAWGCGTMTEAAGAVVAQHFAGSSMALLSGFVTGNVGSARVLAKLGFAPAGEECRHCHFRGADVVVQRRRLDLAHWRSLRAPPQ